MGAADDGPSGIATDSQAGSQLRFGLVWTLLLTTPLIPAVVLSVSVPWSQFFKESVTPWSYFPADTALNDYASIVVATAVTLNEHGIIHILTAAHALVPVAGGFAFAVFALGIVGTGWRAIMGSLEVDPIKALLWSAIVNGVISIPVMAVMMHIGQSTRIPGHLTISSRHRWFGWGATILMALAVFFMLATSF